VAHFGFWIADFGLGNFNLKSKIANPKLGCSGKGHGWGDFWRSTEDITAFADWFDRYLRDRRD
jgi:hypothetical protein